MKVHDAFDLGILMRRGEERRGEEGNKREGERMNKMEEEED